MRLKKLLLTAGLALTGLLAAIPRAKATTCPNAIAITAIPVFNQSVVCGTTNDITSTNTVVSCGSTLYYGGLEALYTFTATTTGAIEISFNGGTTTNYAGIFVFSGCPTTTGTTCIGAANSSSTYTTSLVVSVTSGTTYYLMFDTWPTPASPCPGTFSISTCARPTALTTTAITTTTANLGFTNAGGTQWEIERGTSATLGNAANTRVVTTANPYPATGLTFATTYYWWVRRICGPGDTSAWAGSSTFTTAPLCSAPTAVNATAVTTTGATLNWTAPSVAPSNGYEYEVRTSGAAGSGATGLAANGSTLAGVTTATVSTLTPGTLYRVYVRGNCGTTNGNSTWTAAFVFYTLCNPITTLPWNDGFESVTTTGTGIANFPACWRKFNGDWGTRDSAFTTYNDPRTGSRYLTNTYGGANEWMITPGFQLTAGTNYDFSFYWAGDGLTGWDGHVGVNGTQDTTGITILGAPFVTNTVATPLSTYAQVIRTFTPATTGTYYFAVRVTANSTPWYLGFDDFSLMLTPSCAQPTVTAATNVAPTTATINWTASVSSPANGYQYEVRTTGAAGSGATGLIASGSTAAGMVTASITGLSGVTTYQVYVRSVCAATTFSPWAQGTFTTPLDCATATNITACGVSQTVTLTGTGSYNPIQTPTGPGIFGTPGVEKLYTFTATVTGPYTLNVTAATGGYVDYFYKVSSAGCANSNWIYIDDVNAPVNNIVNLVAGTQYFFLLDPEQTTSMTQTFSIICPPTCGQPTALTTTATTTTSATLGWTQPAPGTPAQWQISYGTGITTPGAGTTVVVSTNPYTLSGLTTATNYTYYVRAICGPGDTSTWSSSFTFATACNAFAAPFFEGFASGSMPVCWTNSNTTSVIDANALWKFSGAPGYGTTANGRPTGTYAWVDASVPHNVVVMLTTPSIDLSTVTNPLLEFEWYKNNTDPAPIPQVNNNLRVEGNPGTGWVTLFDDTSNAAAWRTVSMMLPPAFANTTAQFRFVVDKNLSNDFYDDVLLDSVRVIQCSLPTVNLGTDTTLCGTGLSLTLNAGPGTSYNWSTGDTTQSITVSNAGTYGVTVVNGSSVCNATDSITVSTGTLPVVNLGPDVTVCGDVASLLLDAGNPGANYTWSSPVAVLPVTTQVINLGPVINALNQNSAGLGVNTAPVYATVTNAAGCMGMDSVNVSVIFTARVDNITTGGTDPNMTFTPMADSFATSYNWTFGDGSAAVTTQNATHTYNTNGTFTVRLIVSNSCSSDTVTTTVTIMSASVSDVALGQGTLNLYPNPTAADATLEVSNGLKLRGVQMMSATGQVVMARTLDGGTRTTLNTSMLAPGIYTLRVQLDKGVVVRKLEVLK